MTDPGYDLQAAIWSILTALNVASVYDRIPSPITDSDYPLIHIGDDQIIGDTYQYSNSSCARVNVHVFSRSPAGKAEIKGLVRQIIPALEDYITVSNFWVVTFTRAQTRYLTEADGLTEHAIIEIEYELVPYVAPIIVNPTVPSFDMTKVSNSEYIGLMI